MSTHRPPPLLLFGVLLAALAVAVVAGLLVGSGDLGDATLRETFLSLRGHRIVAALLVGAALAAGGVVVQGLFRNPLASPSVLGTTAGASLGGQISLLSGQLTGVAWSPEMSVPLGCLLGALVSLAVLLLFLRARQDLLALLLTGFVLSSLFLSIGSFLTSLAQNDWELGRAVVAFTLGGVGGVGRPQLLFAIPLVAVGLVAAYAWGPTLDVLLSGEDEASTLGVEVQQVRWWSAVWVSVLVAGAVSLGGNVGFVGLVVPHALRPFAGATHRRLLPASALAGGVFVVMADVIARAMPSVGEIPLGVVTGIVGAPLFLLLLLRTRRAEARGA